MIIHFNTGRLYQADGQRISASFDGTTVLIHDHSRMIWGEFTVLPQTPPPTDAAALRRLVMSRYDRNDYRMSSAASALRWEDPQKIS